MPASTILKVSNVSKRVSRSQLKDVFKGIKLNTEDIFFSSKSNANPTTVAYLVINDQEEASKAILRSGRYVEGFNISILLSNVADMNRDTSSGPPTPSESPRPSPRNVKDRSFQKDTLRNRPRPYDRQPPTPDHRLGRGPGGALSSPHSRGPPRASPQGRPAEFRKGPGPMNAQAPSRFLYLSGIPYSATELEIQGFFKGNLTRKIFIVKNKEGRFVGQSCGEALLEFFNEADALHALQKNGESFGNRKAFLKYVQELDARKIMDAEGRFHSQNQAPRRPMPPPAPAPAPVESRDQAILREAAPQLQNLLSLLGSLSNPVNVHSPGMRTGDGRPQRLPPHAENVSDVGAMRVADSANINKEDIRLKRVVGIRSLPVTVTPPEILDFFRGFRPIPQSVRIHYQDNGKSSGDALISFRSSVEARNAVNALNHRPVGHKRIELFIL